MTSKKSRKKFWLALIALIVISGLGTGWLLVHEAAEGRIESQLSGIGLGRATVSGVSLRPSGIRAHDVSFQRPSKNQSTPWLNIGMLKVDHPLSSLLAGAKHFNQLEIRDSQGVIDWDDPTTEVPTPEWIEQQLDQFAQSLPARNIKIDGFDLTLRQPKRNDIRIEGLDAQLDKKSDGQLALSGSIHRLANRAWQFAGSRNPQTKTSKLTINTQQQEQEEEEVDEQELQSLPGVPESLSQYFQGDLDADVDFDFQSGGDQGLTWKANIRINPSQIVLPNLNQLSLKLLEGEVTVNAEKLTFENILATTDDEDQIQFSGSTKLGEDPVVTTFEGRVESVDVDVIRKLVADLPEELRGKVSGPIQGEISVDEQGETTVKVQSQLKSSAAWYGQIHSRDLNVDVLVDSLALGPEPSDYSLDGSVRVDAEIQDQPLEPLMATFELQDVTRRLGLSGNGTGRYALNLPLATVDDMATWTMEIRARLPTATIGGQVVHRVDLQGKLKGSDLVLAPIRGELTENPGDTDQPQSAENRAELITELTIPLVEIPAAESVVGIAVQGKSVPGTWMIRFLNHQLAQLDELEEQVPMEFPDELSGRLNFRTRIDVPTADADDIQSWTANGSITESTVGWGRAKLDQLAAKIDLADGIVTVKELVAKASQGGQFSGRGQLALIGQLNSSASINYSDLSVPWLSSLAAQLADDSVLVAWDDQAFGGTVSGQIDIQNEMAEASPGWQVAISANSSGMTAFDTSFTELVVEAGWDPNQVRVQRLSATAESEGRFTASADWDLSRRRGQGQIEIERFPIGTLLAPWLTVRPQLAGLVSGELEFRPIDELVDAERVDDLPLIPVKFLGSMVVESAGVADYRVDRLAFDVTTRDRVVWLENIRGLDLGSNGELVGQIGLESPYSFSLAGSLDQFPLSRVSLSRKDVFPEEYRLSGLASSQFELNGTIEPWDWNSSGQLRVIEPRVNYRRLSDIRADWDYKNRDWEQSVLNINAFDGKIEMTELARAPERVRLNIENIDAEQLSLATGSAVDWSGRLSGDVSLNEWSLDETRWAELNLQSGSLGYGSMEFGDFIANADYRNEVLAYEIQGKLLGGSLVAEGQAEAPPSKLNPGLQLPVSVRLANAKLEPLIQGQPGWRQLRWLQANIDAEADAVLHLDDYPTGSGRISMTGLKWKNELISSDINSEFALNQGKLFVERFRADLRRGGITGRADIPLFANVNGNYQIEVRHFDMQRLTEFLMKDAPQAEGLLDARLSGQLGQRITGRGFVGVERTDVLGLKGQALRLPVQYHLVPANGTGRIELRRSRFRLFNGNASGTAFVRFGTGVDLEVDLEMIDVDTSLLFASISGITDNGQGSLNGRFKLDGRGVRSPRDLNGSFRGSLMRAEAFELPVLSAVAGFLNRGQLRRRDYRSDEVDLRLANGRVEVKQLNLYNSLARIAVGGFVYLDGRLDLNLAARIEQFNQPTLLEQLAGSPLARFRGSPASFFAQASQFLSERLIFLNIRGTVQRPRISPDTGRQLREELIRYFINDSEYLPFSR